MAYINEKQEAIDLRKKGKTYSEILKEVPVAKSTLSEWFRDVKLSKPEFQKLTEKRLLAAKRGGEAKRVQRIEKIKTIREQSLKDITHISKRELWLIGTALYWAEGSKEKEYSPGVGLKFNNSDPKMIRLFIIWLNKICGISNKDIVLEIYIHKNSKNNIELVRKYWAKTTGFPIAKLCRIYYKRNKIKTNRKNIGDLYYGGIRVKVKSSSTLVRQIAAWSDGIFNNL